MAVTVVRAVIAIISVPFVTSFVIAACWAIRPGNPVDIFMMAQVGLLGIGVLVGDGKHLTNQRRWLPIELPVELVMMVDTVDEGGDDLGLQNVRNTIPNLGETPDVTPKELTRLLIYSGQVMLHRWPLACSLVVFDEHSPEVIPRINDIGLEAREPVHGGGLEHN